MTASANRPRAWPAIVGLDRGSAVDGILSMTDAERRSAVARWRVSKRPVERVAAARTLQFIDDSVEPLRLLVDDPNPWVGAEALLVLAQVQPKEARRHIARADLCSATERVREAIVGAAAGVAAEGASRAVREALILGVNDRSPQVRSWALLGMSFLPSVRQSDIDEAARAMRTSRSFEVRLEAIEMLTRHAPSVARPGFVRELARGTFPPGIAIDLAHRLATPAEADALEAYWRQLPLRERRPYAASWKHLTAPLREHR
jgi:hypothetical protein